MCTPSDVLPGAEADHGYRQRLGKVLRHLAGHDLGHDREAAGVDERLRILDELLRALRGLALRGKAAELRHAHRADADVALNRDAGLDDRLDVPRMMHVALALHHFGTGLRDVLRGIVDRMLLREVEAHVGHVHHAQTVLRSALHGLRHEHDFLERHRGGRLVTEQHHPAGIADAQDVDSEPVGDDGVLVVVHGQLDDRLLLLLLLHQHRNGDFLALCGCGSRFGHVFLRVTWGQVPEGTDRSVSANCMPAAWQPPVLGNRGVTGMANGSSSSFATKHVKVRPRHTLASTPGLACCRRS